MFSSSFFSVITHLTAINNNINDNEKALGLLTNSQRALGSLTNNLTDNQEALRPLTATKGPRDP